VGWCRASLPSQARELAHEAGLIYKPNPVNEVGFIREKGTATATAVQQSPETGSLLLR
jgi:hypothetical protein